MSSEDALRIHPPGDLGLARATAHKAVQLLTLAARANLEAVPDDSHSNLGWDVAGRRFLSQPLPGPGGALSVSAGLSPLTLALVREDRSAVATLDLDGCSHADALAWLDGELAAVGLEPASGASIPYDLPGDVAGVEFYAPGEMTVALSVLSAWFHFAHVRLSDFAGRVAGIRPGPSAVRCWPHHFDIATYVSLEDGDFETARGIGVGLSPGDDSHDQPYFYINPWPRIGTPDLADLPAPGRWSQAGGNVGGLATGDAILAVAEPGPALSDVLDRAFAGLRSELGV